MQLIGLVWWKKEGRMHSIRSDPIQFDLTEYGGSDHYYNMSMYQWSVTTYRNGQMGRRYCPIATVVFQ
jgi:hypothetical protein